MDNCDSHSQVKNENEKTNSNNLLSRGNILQSTGLRYLSGSIKRFDRFILENHAIVLRIIFFIVLLLFFFIKNKSN